MPACEKPPARRADVYFGRFFHKDNLDHTTAVFTLDVYGHVTSQMKQTSASRMEQFISAVSS